IVAGTDECKLLFEKAFDKKLVDSSVALPGVVSRKKTSCSTFNKSFCKLKSYGISFHLGQVIQSISLEITL
ncbi:hypothetical protein HMPREF9212_0575, partial [Lactobacillus iners LactinV 03V1-b]